MRWMGSAVAVAAVAVVPGPGPGPWARALGPGPGPWAQALKLIIFVVFFTIYNKVSFHKKCLFFMKQTAGGC